MREELGFSFYFFPGPVELWIEPSLPKRQSVTQSVLLQTGLQPQRFEIQFESSTK